MEAANLRLVKVIGEGSYGTVYIAKDINTEEEYAVKVYNKKILNKEELERVNIEAYVMNNFNHKNILRFKQIIEDNENVYMILEYAKNGDLLEYIKNKNRLSEQEARCFFIQILNALEYTHDIGIIHRDIKLENILLNEKNEIILGDWGFASQWSPQKKINL